MKILAMDTALGACSVAILVDGEVKAHVHEIRPRGHAEALVPMVQKVLAEAAIEVPGLDRIATTVGPGTFTGIRVGLAAARGFALASGVALVGVTTLETLAAAAAERLAADDPAVNITVAIDARGGQVYCQTFRRCAATPGIDGSGPPEIMPVAVAGRHLPRGPLVIVGSGAALVLNAVRDHRSDAGCPDFPDQPDARLVAVLGSLCPPSPPHSPPAPLYLRPPDARLPGPDSR